jgi:hypothetical protein
LYIIFLIIFTPPDFFLQIYLFVIYFIIIEMYNLLLKFLKFYLLFIH